MCVAGYLGPEGPNLLKAREALAGLLGVSYGPKPLVERDVRGGEGYGSVGDYDPVLRAHCRLDKEG